MTRLSVSTVLVLRIATGAMLVGGLYLLFWPMLRDYLCVRQLLTVIRRDGVLFENVIPDVHSVGFATGRNRKLASEQLENSIEQIRRIDGGRPAVPKLIEMLGDPAPRVRLLAAYTLYRLANVAQEARPALVRCLEDRKAGVSMMAEEALLNIANRNQTVEYIKQVLPRAEAATRSRLISIVGELANTSPSALPVLMAAIKDSDPMVRIEAIKGLRATEVSSEVCVIMRVMLHDEDAFVQLYAAEALASQGVDLNATIPRLLSALCSGDEAAGMIAAQLLGELGNMAAGAVPSLLAITQSEDEDLRDLAFDALRRIFAN